MNKILPIIIIFVLSSCSNRFAYHNPSGGNLNDLLDARNQCLSELGSGINVDCRAFNICLRSKGWVKTNKVYRGVGVPEKYRIKCKGF
jgi:hypothetical protein